jgi:hydrogenase 3 maturation protease
LAVGSKLRGDDAAGLLVADYLEKSLTHPSAHASARPATSNSQFTIHNSQFTILPAPSSIPHSPSSNPQFTIHNSQFFRIFRGHTAPENCTGAIKKFAPTHLVVVDAAELGQPPGTIAVLEPEQIAGVSFSTHQLPLSVLLDYLKTSFAFEAIVIAIQPAHLAYDQPVTPAVRRAARRLAAALAGCV